MKRLLTLLLNASLVQFVCAAPAFIEQVPLWTAGQGGYHTYRIPALLVTAKGSVLAFCEGRKTGPGDHGDVDLITKRSTDGGRTWSCTARNERESHQGIAGWSVALAVAPTVPV